MLLNVQKHNMLSSSPVLGLNTTQDDMRDQTYALVFGSVVVLGLPLNAVSLWILLCRHSLKSPSVVFMVNLAVSDLLLVISLPMRVYFYATGVWPLGNMTCIWITMLFRNNIRSSSIFITFISVDRLLAVVYPLRSRHNRTSSNAWRAAALVWIFVVVVNIPESFSMSRFLNNTSQSICFEFRQSPTTSGVSYLQPVLLFTMLAVNIVSTALVSWTLRTHLNDSARVGNKVNVMLLFVMNLLMFIIFFLPVSLVVFFNRKVLTPLVCLASVNCCLDPLLYYFSFDGFWKKKEDVDSSRE
ncbi:lysophosphatidic acid receptor 5b [Mastacembelus armatus]|uniref:Lysophosphatidic acid receptor 5b n=1 Tax=Mastacembelus armatus TaxID=205130 RepID=A0A7N9AUC8_9TELE|nr:lysophosphatidic acid receptor 6-like [Mastacembelus armatus]